MARIPEEYHTHILGEKHPDVPSPDSERLGMVKHYRSLVPMAQEARKPVFLLKPADGAIGAHASAVHSAYEDFRDLARAILERAGLMETA